MTEEEPLPPKEVATPRPRRRTPQLRDVAPVATGGAIGALARVGLAERFPVADDAFPWTTLVENLIGALALGLVLTLLVERFTADRWVRLLVCTGALGAFTTYSTVAKELAGRVLGGRPLLAAAYVMASLLGGVVAALLGARAARAWPWVRHRLRRGAPPGKRAEG